MGRTLTLCGLLMAALVAIVGWLQPGSFIMWFAATGGELAVARWVIVGILAGLFVADLLTDSWLLRWLAGVVSVVLAYDASRILIDHSVYMLDFLIAALAAVCSAIVAIQPRAGEQRALPSDPRPAERPLPVFLRTASLFERMVQPIRLRRRALPGLLRVGRDQDIADNRHRLTIGYRT